MRIGHAAMMAWMAMAAGSLAACANPNGAANGSGAQTASAPLPSGEHGELAAPQALRIYFGPGASAVGRDGRAVLDQAARLFREGDPLVMTVSGQADTTGDPRRNLLLSQARATAVARGLMDRGIPASRLEIVAKGEADLLVKTADGVAQPENRAVIITWRK